MMNVLVALQRTSEVNGHDMAMLVNHALRDRNDNVSISLDTSTGSSAESIWPITPLTRHALLCAAISWTGTSWADIRHLQHSRQQHGDGVRVLRVPCLVQLPPHHPKRNFLIHGRRCEPIAHDGSDSVVRPFVPEQLPVQTPQLAVQLDSLTHSAPFCRKPLPR